MTRDHFSKQQYNPSFIPHEYEKNTWGKYEIKIENKFKTILLFLARIFKFKQK